LQSFYRVFIGFSLETYEYVKVLGRFEKLTLSLKALWYYQCL
jgi:hypothetical protein